MTFLDVQAFGISDTIYGTGFHIIAGESVDVEWSDVANIIGTWPPPNLNTLPNPLPVTFPGGHSNTATVSFVVTAGGSASSSGQTITLDLLINGVVVDTDTQTTAFDDLFFGLTAGPITGVAGQGPQIRLTNNGGSIHDDIYFVLIGDIITEFPSSMDVTDDSSVPSSSGAFVFGAIV